MDQFDRHPGTAKLAQVLDRRTSQKTESPLTLDFGEIQANGSLKTNTFPVPIPKGDYTICRLAAGLTLSTSEQSWLNKAPSGVPLHSHSVILWSSPTISGTLKMLISTFSGPEDAKDAAIATFTLVGRIEMASFALP